MNSVNLERGISMESNLLFSSERLRFRRTEVSDLSFVCCAEADEANCPYIIPWSRQKHETAVYSEGMLHILIESVERQPIGYMILSGRENPNQCLELIRIVVVDKGRGYGNEAIRSLQTYVFDTLKSHRLWLDVKQNNSRARHVYESAGFVVEGVLRECLKSDQQYESLIIMGMIESDYKRIVEAR